MNRRRQLLCGLLALLSTLSWRVSASARSGARARLERQSVPSAEMMAAIVRQFSFSPAGRRSLVRQGVWDAALAAGLARGSSLGPGQQRRLEAEAGFSPSVLRRLETCSELGEAEARRLRAESCSLVFPPLQTGSSALVAELVRNTRRGAPGAAPAVLLFAAADAHNGLVRSSVPSPGFLTRVRRRSVASDVERRVIRRLSLD